MGKPLTMNGISIQQWQVAYAVVALLFAMAAVVAAHQMRDGESPSSAAEATAALTAGALWPVMIIGLLQLGAIHCVVSRLRTGPARAPEVAERELAATH